MPEPNYPTGQAEYDKELSDIYRWLPLQCGDQVLGDLISTIHEEQPSSKKEITKTGSIEHKIRMLRRAIGLGFISKDNLVELLQRCEESGQQWIHLYTPNPKDKAILSDSSKVADQLFDKKSRARFPQFEWPEDELLWADFRPNAGPQGDWVLKIYGHAIRKNTLAHKDGEKIAEGRYRDWVDYELKPAYVVHVVRWRNREGLLEVRIDKEGALGRKSSKIERFNSVVDMVLPAFNISAQVAKRLQPSCENLLKRRFEKNLPLRIGHVRVEDKSRGKNQFVPLTSSTSLDSDKGRSRALSELLSNGGKPIECCVMLQIPLGMGKPSQAKEELDEGDTKDDELRVVIGGDYWNEISISRRISPELLDYVIQCFCRTYA